MAEIAERSVRNLIILIAIQMGFLITITVHPANYFASSV
jgi:hypothetical protein